MFMLTKFPAFPPKSPYGVAPLSDEFVPVRFACLTLLTSPFETSDFTSLRASINAKPFFNSRFSEADMLRASICCGVLISCEVKLSSKAKYRNTDSLVSAGVCSLSSFNAASEFISDVIWLPRLYCFSINASASPDAVFSWKTDEPLLSVFTYWPALYAFWNRFAPYLIMSKSCSLIGGWKKSSCDTAEISPLAASVIIPCEFSYHLS